MPEELSLEGKTLLLVDGSSYLYRAYHAMPDLRGPDGGPTGALYGMVNMLRRLRREINAEYSACVFDAKGKTFRDDWYADYKANRPSMPDDLARQIEPIHVTVRALGWPLVMIEGVEADDVIGTLAVAAEKRGMKVIVSTGDKDLAQLVTDHVTLINTMTNETLDRAGVAAKFGVPPERIVDYLSLIGDTVDNVPGVEKCGPKTALKWLTQYETLDGIVAHADEIKGAVGDNLRKALDFLPMARKLVTVHTECDLGSQIESIEATLPSRPESREELRDLFTRHGFKTWLREVEIADAVEGPTDTPPAEATEIVHHYDTVQTWEQFDAWLAKIDAAELTAFDTETTALDPMVAQLVGLSVSVEPGHAAYIPVAHRGPDMPVQLPRDEVLAEIEALARGCIEEEGRPAPEVRRAGARELWHRAEWCRARHAAAIVRARIAPHARHGQPRAASSRREDDQVRRRGGQGRIADRLRRGRARQGRRVRGRGRGHHACVCIRRCIRKSPMKLALLHVYRDIELPTSRVLRKMERNGVLIDREKLREQSSEIAARLIELEGDGIRAGGRRIQSRVAEADRADLLREAAIAGGEEDAERRAIDR